MRVRTVETISELQRLLNLPREGRLLEPDLDIVETDCDHHQRKRRDAEVLCTLAANARGHCLDLGTSHGRSAFKLATNLPAGHKVFTVNILPEQYDASGGKLITHLLSREEIGSYYRQAGLRNVEQHYANTAHWEIPAEINQLALVFIHAAHDEDMVYTDSRLIYDRVAPGGFICWHDFNPSLRSRHDWIDECMNGVERFLREYGLAETELYHLKDSWIAVLRKPPPLTRSVPAVQPRRSMRELRYLWVFPAYDQARVAEDRARVERIRSWGYDIQAFPLNCPGGWWHFPKLDRAWQQRDRFLLDQYDALRNALVDRDVLIAAGGSMLHPEFVEQLEAYTVFTCCDDPESSEVLSRPAAPAFDFAFSMNVACLDDYRAWGCRKVDWFYHAIQPEATAPGITEESILNQPRDLDIVLLCERVFNLSDRARRVEQLIEAFPQAFVRGRGWPGGHVEPAPVYARARIGWNLHNSIGPCNSRLITLPANGVLQICDNKSHLGRLFKLDEEVVGFDTLEECVEKTRYYLAHEDERRRIAANGWKRVHRDYTEQAQWERILDCIKDDYFQQRAAEPTPSLIMLESSAPVTLPRITGARPKVLLLADRPGWAYDNAARHVARQLSDEFEFRIEYVARQPDLKAWPFDLLYVFFWGETYHHRFNIPPEKVIKEISSHRWANEDQYGRLNPEQTARQYLRDARTWTATSRRLRDLFNPIQPVFHVPNGFSPDEFSPPERRGPLRLGWAGNAQDPCKGLHDILAPASGEDFELHVADGSLSAAQMSRFYQSIDVLCVASTAEGEPLTLVEGMASGCFPVCVDVGIVPELVAHRENGLIVERSPEAFQAAWQWCRLNPQKVREAGRRNAFSALQTRRWEVVAEQWRQPLRSAWLGLQGGHETGAPPPDSAEMWQRNLGTKLLQWPARARKAAEWIDRIIPCPQEHPTLVDLGCGHQTLRELIPARFTYTPVDNLARTPDVQVYDLEHERPDQHFSVAVSLGLLEYLDHLESFLDWVATHAGSYLFSYNDCSDPERLRRQHWKCRWSFDRIVDFLRQRGGRVLRAEDLGKREMLCALTFDNRRDARHEQIEVRDQHDLDHESTESRSTRTIALLSAAIDGDNSGDALIVDAIRRILRGNELAEFPLLQPLDARQIGAINECDAVIICGTNLYQHVFACPLTPDIIAKIRIPIVPLGVGGSAPIGCLPQMDAEGARAVRMIHDRCELGSVRDPASLEFIRQLGIQNVELTACPVLFHALREPEFKADPGHRVALSIRARLLHVEEHWNRKQEQTLRRLCERFKPTLVLQSPYDLDLARRLHAEFGVEYRHDPAWQHGPLVQTLADSDRAVGFRLHFGMLSLAYGHPSTFLATDTRTTEFCNMVGVPFHSVQEYDDARLIAELQSTPPDYSRFRRRWRELAAVMADTLERNGIPHVLRDRIPGL